MSRSDETVGKVFVGNLPKDAREKEVENAFTPFGEVKSVWVARNPPGFGFVQFEDPRDAKDAVRMLDGTLVVPFFIEILNFLNFIEVYSNNYYNYNTIINSNCISS